jgi:hypothetical protein
VSALKSFRTFLAPITRVRPIFPAEEPGLGLFGGPRLIKFPSRFQLSGIFPLYPEAHFVSGGEIHSVFLWVSKEDKVLCNHPQLI